MTSFRQAPHANAFPFSAPQTGARPLLLVWLPPGLDVHPPALRALAGHVRREYAAGVSLRRQRWPGHGCRLQLLGYWGGVSLAEVHADLARLWAEAASDE